MLDTLSSLWQPAVTARLLLLANHVLLAEPAAVERLRAHRGRSLRLDWDAEPGPWPSPPPLHLRVSPAGLLEAADAESAAELRVRVALPPPLQLVGQWLAGERPAVTVDGDAQFAADVAWLGENLRWDVAHDLDRLIGPAAAQGLTRALGGVGAALAELARRAGGRPNASR